MDVLTNWLFYFGVRGSLRSDEHDHCRFEVTIVPFLASIDLRASGNSPNNLSKLSQLFIVRILRFVRFTLHSSFLYVLDRVASLSRQLLYVSLLLTTRAHTVDEYRAKASVNTRLSLVRKNRGNAARFSIILFFFPDRVVPSSRGDTYRPRDPWYFTSRRENIFA